MEFIEQVGEIAREAGRLVRKMEGSQALDVREKGSSYDLVTAADTASQRLILNRVKQLFPRDQLVGEEDNLPDRTILEHISKGEGRLWVVDPLDGTVNYVRGLGGYAVSIGVFENGEVIAGAIYMPETDELCLAQPGSGATLNGRPIHVAEHASLHEAIGATHVPVSNQEPRRRFLRWEQEIVMASQNMRLIGSSARTQCKVASGALDFYFENGPHPWDVAAGSLIVREAGGVASRLDGGAFEYGQGGVLIGSKAIHAELVELFNRIDPRLSEL